MSTSTIRILGFAKKYSKGADGEMVAHDWVTFAPAHAVQSVVNEERVDRLKPKDGLANDDQGLRAAYQKMRWSEIEPAYEAWKSGNSVPEVGTPLAAWPGVSKEQVEVLRMSAIRTVEEVANLSENLLMRIQLPGMRELREQAQRFLDASDTDAVADRMRRQDEELAAVKEQLAEAIKMLSDATEPPKPRGRKAKEEADAEPEAEAA